MSGKKTAIVTGAQQGIGAGLVEGLLKEGYNVVARSLQATQVLTASPSLVLVDGDIGKQETAVKAVEVEREEPLPLGVWRRKPSARHPGGARKHFRRRLEKLLM